MPTFHYEAMGAKGEAVAGGIEAADADAAMRVLRARGLFVSGLAEVAEGDADAGASERPATESDSAASGNSGAGHARKGRTRRKARRAVAAFLRDPHCLLRDPSFWTLVGSDALAGWFAIREHWPAIAICWAFWLQTVLMTVSSYFRIRFAREFIFGSYSCSINGKPLPNTRDGLRLHARAQVGISAIFLGFALPFFIGLSSPSIAGQALKGQVVSLLWAAAAFTAHSLFEFLYSRIGTPRREDIGALAGGPIFRSFAMLFWIFWVLAACGLLNLAHSRWYWIPLLVVMVLKTATDVLLFAIENLAERESEDKPARLPRNRGGRKKAQAGAAKAPDGRSA